jgi:hypothetical protein
MHGKMHPEAMGSANFIGGPTVLLELDGIRLLTDPTFDAGGSRYQQGPISMNKLQGVWPPS